MISSEQAAFCARHGWIQKAQDWRNRRWEMWEEDQRRLRAGRFTGYYRESRIEVNI